MWPFNKKKILNTETGKIEEIKPKPVPRVNTKKIIFEEQEFEVGKTFIDLEFVDGTKFTVESLGRVEQSFGNGRNEVLNDDGEVSRTHTYTEACAVSPTILSSEQTARNLISKFGVGQVFKFVNQYDNLFENQRPPIFYVHTGVCNPTEANASREIKEVVHHELRRAKIGGTMPHKVKFTVAKLEDISK